MAGQNEVNIRVTADGKRAKAEIKAIKSEADDLGKSFSAAGKAVGDFGGKLAKFKTFAPMVGAGAGAVGALGAAAGAAAPLLVSLGAAGAVVAAGMDGIKSAAKEAEGGLSVFKKTVSDTFDRMLSPSFKKIGKTLTEIDGAASEAAGGIAQLMASALDTVSAEKNLGKLHEILWGTAALTAAMAPGVEAFTQGLIDAGSAGSTSMDGLGEAIGGVLGELGKTFSELAADGTIGRAIDGFSATLTGLGKVVGSVVDVLARMGAEVGDGLGVFLTDLSVGLDNASPGLQDLANAGGELLKALGPLMPVLGELAGEVFHQIADAVRDAIPHIQAFAQWAAENKDTLKEWVPIIMGAVVAWKAFGVAMSAWKAGSAVVSTLGAVARAVGLIGTEADGAEKKVGRLKKAMDGLDGGDVDVPGKRKGKGGKLGKLGKGGLIAAGIGGAALGVSAATSGEHGDPNQSLGQHYGNMVGDNVDKVMSGDFEGLYNNWKTFLTRLVGEVGAGLDSLKETIKSKIVGLWDGFTTSLAGVGTSITTTVSGWWTSITTGASQLGTMVLDAIQSGWTTVTGWFSQLGTSILTPLQEAWQQVTDFFNQPAYDIGFQIGQMIGRAINAVGTWFSELGTSIVNALTTAWNAVTTWFTSTLPALLDQGWQAAKTWFTVTLPQTATEAWNAFTTALQTAWQATLAWIQSVPQMVSDGLVQLGTFLQTKATEAWTAFTTALQTAWTATIAWVQSVPQMVVDGLAALVGLLQTKATEAWNAFQAACVSAFDATLAWCRGLPGAISGAVGDLGSTLLDAGRSLMDGLLAGIKSAYQSVLDFVSGIADGIAAVKGPLPYDRKVLRPHGRALMEGLGWGMRRGYRDVRRWVRRVAPGVGDVWAGVQGSSASAMAAAGARSAGGMVQAEDGSWVPASFYSRTSRGRDWGGHRRRRGHHRGRRHDRWGRRHHRRRGHHRRGWGRDWDRHRWAGSAAGQFAGAVRDGSSVWAGVQLDQLRDGTGTGGLQYDVGRRGQVHFSGNTDSAFASAFQKLVRTGKIQITI